MDARHFKAPYLWRTDIWKQADELRLRLLPQATLPVPVLSLDASAQNSGRLTLRFENLTGNTNQTVFCSQDLTAPAGTWTAATILNAADETT